MQYPFVYHMFVMKISWSLKFNLISERIILFYNDSAPKKNKNFMPLEVTVCEKNEHSVFFFNSK